MLKSACLEVQDSWSAPGSGPRFSHRINEFEKLVDKIDSKNKELYLLGDVNCNLLPEVTAHISSSLTNILDVY